MSTRETHQYSDAQKLLIAMTAVLAICFLAGVDAGLDKAHASQPTKADRTRIMAELSPCSEARHAR